MAWLCIISGRKEAKVVVVEVFNRYLGWFLTRVCFDAVNVCLEKVNKIQVYRESISGCQIGVVLASLVLEGKSCCSSVLLVLFGVVKCSSLVAISLSLYLVFVT